MGKISKQWAGLLREAFTDADYFGITFPMDLDVKMKAVMIGACFLIVSTDVGPHIHLTIIVLSDFSFRTCICLNIISNDMLVVIFSVSACVWEL